MAGGWVDVRGGVGEGVLRGAVGGREVQEGAGERGAEVAFGRVTMMMHDDDCCCCCCCCCCCRWTGFGFTVLFQKKMKYKCAVICWQLPSKCSTEIWFVYDQAARGPGRFGF